MKQVVTKKTRVLSEANQLGNKRKKKPERTLITREGTNVGKIEQKVAKDTKGSGLGVGGG
jgi:hypothetical protein